MGLSFKDVAEILKIIDSSECEEVSLEIEGIRLVVRRGHGASSGAGGALPSASQITRKAEQPAEPQPPSTESEASGSAARVDEGHQVDEGHKGVHAPMVGTVYLRPAPDEPLFVEVGTRLEKGAPLCLIEVMKLYTTIEAPLAGVVTAIHVDDATLVAFDQLLFEIKPE